MPPELMGHESIWDMVCSATWLTVDERDTLLWAHYYGYVDPDMSRDERMQWREYADELRANNE